MACYEDLRQALAATAKERDEAVKRLREWEKFWADIDLEVGGEIWLSILRDHRTVTLSMTLKQTANGQPSTDITMSRGTGITEP